MNGAERGSGPLLIKFYPFLTQTNLRPWNTGKYIINKIRKYEKINIFVYPPPPQPHVKIRNQYIFSAGGFSNY